MAALDLPAEVLDMVFTFVMEGDSPHPEKVKDLKNFAIVCRFWAAPVQRVLLRNLVIYSRMKALTLTRKLFQEDRAGVLEPPEESNTEKPQGASDLPIGDDESDLTDLDDEESEIDSSNSEEEEDIPVILSSALARSLVRSVQVKISTRGSSRTIEDIIYVLLPCLPNLKRLIIHPCTFDNHDSPSFELYIRCLQEVMAEFPNHIILELHVREFSHFENFISPIMRLEKLLGLKVYGSQDFFGSKASLPEQLSRVERNLTVLHIVGAHASIILPQLVRSCRHVLSDFAFGTRQSAEDVGFLCSLPFSSSLRNLRFTLPEGWFPHVDQILSGCLKDVDNLLTCEALITQPWSHIGYFTGGYIPLEKWLAFFKNCIQALPPTISSLSFGFVEIQTYFPLTGENKEKALLSRTSWAEDDLIPTLKECLPPSLIQFELFGSFFWLEEVNTKILDAFPEHCVILEAQPKISWWNSHDFNKSRMDLDQVWGTGNMWTRVGF